MNIRILALVGAISMAGCGGGGGGTPPAQSPGPTATPTATPRAQGVHTVSLTLRIPLAAKKSSLKGKPQYVSPSSTQIMITVNSVDTGSGPKPPPADVITPQVTTFSKSTCAPSGGFLVCTVPVQAPPGTVNYTFTVSDGTNNLSTVTTDETIVADQNNPITATLQGIVHTVTVALDSPLASRAVRGTFGRAVRVSNGAAVIVKAYDADANQIVDPGNYANPITLTDPETSTSGATTLQVNSGTAGSVVTVNSPDDSVMLDYAGVAINTFTTGVSGSIPGGGTIGCVAAGSCDIDAATPNDITFTGTFDDDAAHGGLATDSNFGQQTVFFAQASGTQTLVPAETGFSESPYDGTFSIALDPATCGSGGSAVASTTAGPATSFTITALNTGICMAQLMESSWSGDVGGGYPLTNPGHPASVAGNETQNGTFWISVTAATGTINARKR